MASQGHALSAKHRHERPSYDSSAPDPVRSPTSPDDLRRSTSLTLPWARKPSFPNRCTTTPYRPRTLKNHHTCQLARIRPEKYSGDASPQAASMTTAEIVPKEAVRSKPLVFTVVEVRTRHLQSLAMPRLQRRDPLDHLPHAVTNTINLSFAWLRLQDIVPSLLFGPLLGVEPTAHDQYGHDGISPLHYVFPTSMSTLLFPSSIRSKQSN